MRYILFILLLLMLFGCGDDKNKVLNDCRSILEDHSITVDDTLKVNRHGWCVFRKGSNRVFVDNKWNEIIIRRIQ